MEEEPGRYGSGLIFGKFLPPHLGHLYLVEQARARVERLTIAVCSLVREPVPGERRWRWMQELSPGARVVHVTDENPSYPGDDPRFWEIWTETLLRAAGGRPDVLFTSEDYGDEMARHLGCRHQSVDPRRQRVPISGTAIRADPLRHWDFLPDCVRPWYVRRVVLTGSECTGKTTLAQALAAHYATLWVPEYGREYVVAKGAAPVAADVGPIAEGQIAAEDAAARRARKLLVLDTDLVSTVVYSHHYFGACPEWVEAAARARLAPLYLLHHPDVPWLPDPLQRDRPHQRERMHGLFRDALAFRRARVVDIRGSWNERRERALQAVDALLAENAPARPDAG